MDSKTKAIRALSMFEADELPEIEIHLTGKFGAVGVRAYLNEVIDDAITQLLEDVSSRIAEIDAQVTVDIEELKNRHQRDIEEHDRNMKNASPEVREGFRLANAIAAKMDKIRKDTPLVSDHDFQVTVCEGKALRNPGKKIKFEKGLYFYSPDGKTVREMRRNERAYGHAYGDVWESGLGSRNRIQGSSLKELMTKIDKRHPNNS